MSRESTSVLGASPTDTVAAATSASALTISSTPSATASWSIVVSPTVSITHGSRGNEVVVATAVVVDVEVVGVGDSSGGSVVAGAATVVGRVDAVDERISDVAQEPAVTARAAVISENAKGFFGLMRRFSHGSGLAQIHGGLI